MKSILFSITAAAAVLVGSTITAEAGPRHSSGYRGEGYVNPSARPSHNSSRYSRGGHSHSNHDHRGYHAQPYKVSTSEVNRYTQPRTAYRPNGRRYTYYVTVVTYCDHYSNGTTRTWSRTFS